MADLLYSKKGSNPLLLFSILDCIVIAFVCLLVLYMSCGIVCALCFSMLYVHCVAFLYDMCSLLRIYAMLECACCMQAYTCNGHKEMT